jgi:indole-3-glycerol phosphate synthase
MRLVGSHIRGTILGQIVEDTEVLIAQRKRQHSVSSLENEPGFGRTTRSLFDSLRQDGLSIIAEIKKASPSKGVIREDFDPPALARSYREGGARALSVLTEPLHFQGSPAYLKQVREVVDIPLLRKDFILDPYQVFEARAWGADAILLIAACLDRNQLAELHAAATELGLDALVEVYDPRELDRIDLDTVRIVGVNSRDLRTFEVDLQSAINVLSSLPQSLARVAESGLKDIKNFEMVHRAGIDAALVGESFMRADDPGAAVAHVLDELT